MHRHHLGYGWITLAAAGLGVALASTANTALTARAPDEEQAAAASVFTAAQAATGRDAYQARCASCHLADLGGRNEASPLAGSSFMNVWRARSSKDLYDYIRTSMPPGGATLGAEEYLSITAFILQANGAPAGAAALTPTTAVAIGAVASGVRPTTAAPAAAPAAAGSGPARGRSTGAWPLRCR